MDGPGKNTTERLTKSAVFLIMGLVFLNPFPHTTFIDQLLFYAALIPLMVLVKNKYDYFYYRSPLLYPLAIFFIWSVVSVIFALDKPDSAHVLYSHLIRYLIFYLVMINLFSTKERLVSIAVCIVCSEVFFAISTLVYYYLILGHDISSRLVLKGTPAIAPDVIPFGLITGILLAGWLFKICKNKNQQVFSLIAILVLFVATVATQSRGAFVALCISVPILFWNHKRVLLFLLIIAMVLISQSSLKKRITPDLLFKDKPRLYLICYSLEILKDYPVFGTGFSMNTFRNSDYIDKEEYKARVLKKYQNLEYIDQNVEKRKQDLEQAKQNLEKRIQNLEQANQNLEQAKQNLEKRKQNLEKRKQNLEKRIQNLEKRIQNLEKKRVGKKFNGPHNMFLSIGVRAGIVGMILYAGLFVVSIFTCIKLILYGKDIFIQSHARCCLALLAMFMVNGVLQIVTTHFIDTILFIIFSMVTIVWKINQDTDAVESAE